MRAARQRCTVEHKEPSFDTRALSITKSFYMIIQAFRFTTVLYINCYKPTQQTQAWGGPTCT